MSSIVKIACSTAGKESCSNLPPTPEELPFQSKSEPCKGKKILFEMGGF